VSETEASSSSLDHPERLGPYRIVQVLGEGAMGVVYEAEETGSVRRRVALKVIRSGISSKEVIARFEAERQTLALMNHPGIAKVLGAGTTEGGQPYFAMELVRGLPITAYCDEHKMSVTQRLELFAAVCQAVQHAHQKGIIHRDLKPSNVLVTEQDDVPQPKIIDFGIAKALGTQLTEQTLLTQWGQAIGTPAYMSPEQAESSGVDVDTRADIYSLGVVLYEVLVGRLPVDPGDVGIHSFFVRLKMRETNAPLPSARLRALGVDSSGIALSRRTNPGTLFGEVRGDIDWIVMKALEPDRTRRYATANALAADIQHYLAHEPVTARPPSTVYRLRKFARRHRAGVAAAAIAGTAIVAGAIFSTIAWRRAAREAATSREMTNFLTGLFSVSDPGEARGNKVTAREILDQGSRRIRVDLAGEPLLQGRLMGTMGGVYRALGLYASADSLLRDALRVQEREFGANDTTVATTLTALGDVARARGDFTGAEAYYTRSLAIRERKFGPKSTEAGVTLSGLASVRLEQGRNAQAESLAVRVLGIDSVARGPDDPQTARDLERLALVYWSEGRLPEAEPLMRRALAIQEKELGADHPDVTATQNNLGVLYYTLGRYADALTAYQAALATSEKTLGPDHPDVADMLSNIGETYWKMGKFAEAEPEFRRALAIKEKTLAPGHPSIAITLNGLAGLLRDEKRYAEAAPLYRRALDIRIKALGDSSSDTQETRRDYAELQRRERTP
jgi:non-specific serine/threonine protein kinase/serine/threonine-protein kinase